VKFYGLYLCYISCLSCISEILKNAKALGEKVATKLGKDTIKNALANNGMCPATASWALNTVWEHTKETLETGREPPIERSVIIGQHAMIGGLVGASAGKVLCGPVCGFVGGMVGSTIATKRSKQITEELFKEPKHPIPMKYPYSA